MRTGIGTREGKCTGADSAAQASTLPDWIPHHQGQGENTEGGLEACPSRILGILVAFHPRSEEVLVQPPCSQPRPMLPFSLAVQGWE